MNKKLTREDVLGTPQEPEIEKSILATLLNCPDLRGDIFKNLSVDDFRDTVNRKIFDQCFKLYQRGDPITPTSIDSNLNDNGKKSVVICLREIFENEPIAVDLDFYISKLNIAATRRKAIEQVNAIQKEARSSTCSMEKISALSDSLSQCAKESISNQNHFEIITYDDLYSTDEKPSIPIATGFLDEGEFTIIYGGGGTGKSMLSLDFSMSTGSGIANLWGIFPIPKPRFSLIIQSENTRQVMKNRMTLKCAGNPEFLRGLGFIASPVRHDNILISGDVTGTKFKTYLIDCANRIKEKFNINIDLIIFDPLISYHAFDENDNSRMRSTLDSIAEISNEIGGTPLVIHHTNREGGLRGASAIIDWARNIVGVFDRSFTRDGNLKKQVEVVCDKRNNAQEFDDFTLRMDENLNFYPVEPYKNISSKSRERCLNVKEALALCGGRAEAKSELIEQYCEHTGINQNTAQKHINEASREGYISQEFYLEGKLKKTRYFLPETG